MKKIIILSFTALLLLTGIIYLQFFVQIDSGINVLPAETIIPIDSKIIVRTPTGYDPAEVTINVGETITWKNESKTHHWPASDNHPTHTLLSTFDPREPILSGEVWSYTFIQEGEWRYHDHLRANIKGVVNVVTN